MKKFLLGMVLLCSVGGVAYAQNTPNPDRNKPLEITADESLEWHRNEQYFRARKNVVATQGGTTLKAALLTAKYKQTEKSGMDIHTIEARGNVQILSAKSKAYGDVAVYDVAKGYAVMTGKNLRAVSEDQTITARDKFQYWAKTGRVEAIGAAKAKREGDTLESDKIVAIFTTDKNGKRVLHSLEAVGNVTITTPDEVLKGDKATYSAQTSIAQIHGNVRIARGPNTLNGARGEVNLKTNISKIFGADNQNAGEGKGGRVSGVFYPGSNLNPKNDE